MIELIPAIDLIDGHCVRLTQGAYERKRVYDCDPVELAKQMADIGLKRLHVVDLDGAKAHKVVNAKTLEKIATSTDLVIDFGGGLSSESEVRKAIDAGASLLTIGSLAVKEPQTLMAWAETYGHERFIIAADAQGGKVRVNGWQEASQTELLPFIAGYVRQGFRQFLCTDIDRDGMLQGPSVTLYQDILQAQPDVWLIASGGVSSMEDIRVLDQAGVPAVVFGKAFYEGRITLQDLSRYAG